MSAGCSPRRTVVSFHAHPDDEALLTAGTLAKAAAEGHRVVLVVATAGEAGLAATGAAAGDLGRHRGVELQRSAAAIGCARVDVWGYADSGWSVDPGTAPAADGFAGADVEEVAERLAAILREENADVLTCYDPAGGYGHPDHVMVHRAGILAAARARTPVVLAATVDRRPLQAAARLLRIGLPPGRRLDIPDLSSAYTAHQRLTHCIDVSEYLSNKRAAMAAHASQASADVGMRTLGLLLRLPGPVYRQVMRREWFVEQGRPPSRPLAGDIFATFEALDPSGTRPTTGTASLPGAPSAASDDHHDHDHRHKHQGADLAESGVDPPVGGRREVAEQRDRHRPDRPANGVEEQEPWVRHPAGTSETGHDRS